MLFWIIIIGLILVLCEAISYRYRKIRVSKSIVKNYESKVKEAHTKNQIKTVWESIKRRVYNKKGKIKVCKPYEKEVERLQKMLASKWNMIEQIEKLK